MPDPTAILAPLWRASWQAGVVALIVLALRYTLRDRIPAAWRCRLWGLVFLRLLLPAVPASPLSLFNLFPSQTPTAPVAIPGQMAAVAAPGTSRVTELLLIGWLATAGGLLSATVMAHLAFARRVRRSRLTVPTEVDEHWRFAAGQGRPPRLVVTDAVSTPALFGLFRGRLLLPPNLWGRLSAGELRLVFQHELAHVRRWDLLFGWAAVVIRCIYWFHPLVWVAERCRRADAEAACDDAVLAAADDRVAYGRTLLAVADGRRRVPGVGMADGRTDLRRRLNRIATGRRPGRSAALVAAALTAAVGCTTLTTRPTDPHFTPTAAATDPALATLRSQASLTAAAMNRRFVDEGRPYVATVDQDGSLVVVQRDPSTPIVPSVDPLDRTLAGVPTPDGRGVASRIPTAWDKDATRLIPSPGMNVGPPDFLEVAPTPVPVPAPTTRPSRR